jgi:hypothetical protein
MILAAQHAKGANLGIATLFDKIAHGEIGGRDRALGQDGEPFCHFTCAEARDVLPIQDNRALTGSEQLGADLEQGKFAGTIRPNKRSISSARNVQALMVSAWSAEIFAGIGAD